MIHKHKYQELTWVDVESPSRKEIMLLTKEFEIPLVIADELFGPSARSKVELDQNLIYLILHFPTTRQEENIKTEQEIDFLIGHNFLITTHYEPNDSLIVFSKMLKISPDFYRNNMGNHAGFLFFFMIKELYKHSTFELENIYKKIKGIEKKIFEQEEEKMVRTISDVNRELLDFSQAIRFHSDILKSFESAGRIFFGKDFEHYLFAITGEYNKVQNLLLGHKELLKELRETNDSLLAQKSNEIMKILTIVAFIMMPLTLITGILGMNMGFLFIEKIADFFVIIILMIIIGGLMFLYFKRRKWF